MYCGVVVRFVICVSLVGFTATKCVPEKCGSMNVSYPFWINNSSCGYPGFQINCTKDEDTGMMAPFLYAYKGNNDSDLTGDNYKIMEINYTGYLIIKATSLKAESCNPNSNRTNLFLALASPFTISISNKFVVIGCNTVGPYIYGDWGGEARCISSCYPQSYAPYCRYGCCEITLQENWRWINFTGGRLVYSNDDEDFCGFSTILDPTTFRVGDNKTNFFGGEIRKADYGLRVNWAIGLQNCSTAKATADYSCSSKADCIDSFYGHVCKCLPGYEGDGYSNGTGCTDIDECKRSNACVSGDGGGICHNLAGSYTCSCAKDYEGDGYSNGTSCRYMDECSQTKNMCVEKEEGGKCHNLVSYSCSCAKGYMGDGFKNGSRLCFCIRWSLFRSVWISLVAENALPETCEGRELPMQRRFFATGNPSRKGKTDGGEKSQDFF